MPNYSLYIYYKIVVVTCPMTHPFAYFDGMYCCQYDKTFFDEPIYIISGSCKDNANKTCPGDICKSYEGKDNIVEI